jgi:molecular chaperone DnaK (HSP70)
VLIVGDPAARRHHLDPERVVRQVRRRASVTPTPILLGGVGFDASVLLARMVTDVVSRVSAARGYPPEMVVLSRPASWGPFRRELFDNVSQLAGLPESRTITAAEAAAAHYGAARRIADNEVVAVLQPRRRHLRGHGAAQDVERLRGARRPGVDGAARRHEHRRGAAQPHRPRHRQRTGRSGHHPTGRPRRCSPGCTATARWPRRRSRSTTTRSSPCSSPIRQVDVRLTRATLEGLASPVLEATAGVFRQALDAADVTARDLGAVLLTGGSTRVPLLGRMISDLAGRRW